MPGGALLTVKCPPPGTHRETNARGLPGGMLAIGIDSHINYEQIVLQKMLKFANYVVEVLV